ncbi:retrovirus-related pol polyprotein from transposon TNT 1-94 [Tanacetum coccineum]
METIHVKFNELTTIASEHNCLKPGTNRFQDNVSSAEDTSIPKKEDLDNFFVPMYEEYFKKRSPKVSINSAAQTTLNNQDTPSSSSIIVEDNEAPPLVSSSKEQISPILRDEDDELLKVTNKKRASILKNHLLQLLALKQSGCIVDPALFTRRHGGDILLVQVYVDEIIFGSTNSDFSKRFANLMKNNFEMSKLGELKFFLRLQVHQSPRGIFFSQSQYAVDAVVVGFQQEVLQLPRQST